MQKMGAVDMRLPPWLAQETTTLELLQTWKKGTRQMMHSPDFRTDTRQDIMVVRLTTDAFVGSRVVEICKANKEALLKHMISP